MINAVLCYVTFSLNNPSCQEFYSIEELCMAKDILCKYADTNVRPQYRRRDSTGRSELEAVICDILDRIKALDNAQKMPRYALDPAGLYRIPRSIPAENTHISVCEHLLTLESRLSSVEDTLSSNVCNTMQMEDSMSKAVPYADAAKIMPSSKLPHVPHAPVSEKQVCDEMMNLITRRICKLLKGTLDN